MKPKLSGAQRLEIKMYIKNKLDISPLIENYCVSSEDFTGAIIKKFDRPDEDISGIVLSNCIMGEEGKVTNLNRVIARNCNWRNSIWKGEVWARRGDFRHTSMTDIFLPYIDYRYADLRNCDFCNAVFQIGTAKGLGAQFSQDFFSDLAKSWNVEITLKKAPHGH